MLWDYLLILIVISMVLCLVGFYRYEYFATIGRGFAIAGIGVALFTLNLMHAYDATWPNYVMFALLILYGIRLAIFSLIGEVEKPKEKDHVSVVTKIIAWLLISVLSAAQASPLLFTVEGEYGYYPGFCMWIGMILALAGLVVEILGDIKKNWKIGSLISLKDLGTLLYWLGILFSSLDYLHGFAEFVIALLSYVGIVAAIVLKHKVKQ